MRLQILFLCFALAACSSQAVALRPAAITAARYPNANGQLITLAVRDERPTETIGTRGATVRLGDITAAGDVTSVVSKSVTGVLQEEGFRVEQSTATAANLVIDLRDLSFAEHMGVWTGKREANAAINARVMRSDAIKFEKMYRGSSASHGMFVGTAHGNEALINSALTDALEHLATDNELTAALASAQP